MVSEWDSAPVVVFPIKDIRTKTRADFETDYTAVIRIQNADGLFVIQESLSLDPEDTKFGTWLYFPTFLDTIDAGPLDALITITDSSTSPATVQTVKNLIRFNIRDNI